MGGKVIIYVVRQLRRSHKRHFHPFSTQVTRNHGVKAFIHCAAKSRRAYKQSSLLCFLNALCRELPKIASLWASQSIACLLHHIKSSPVLKSSLLQSGSVYDGVLHDLNGQFVAGKGLLNSVMPLICRLRGHHHASHSLLVQCVSYLKLDVQGILSKESTAHLLKYLVLVQDAHDIILKVLEKVCKSRKLHLVYHLVFITIYIYEKALPNPPPRKMEVGFTTPSCATFIRHSLSA